MEARMVNAQPFRNKSGDVRWRVQYRIDGGVVTDTFATQKAGDEFARKVSKVGGKAARETLRRRRANDAQAPTLREWTERYLDPASGILTGIQPGTRHGYLRIAESSFLPILGDEPIDDITPDDIGRWIAWQEAQPSKRSPSQRVASKTVKNYHALLSNILKKAKDRKLISDNPAVGVRVTEGETREGVFLSPYEFDLILEHILPHYRPLVVFLADTGCRWGEATALTWEDVNLSIRPATARINKSWKKGVDGKRVLGPPKSKKSRRTVPIGELAREYLPAKRGAKDLVFPAVGGGPIWYGMFNTRIWKRAVEKADIGRSPNIHDLRHTAASWLLVGGVTIPEVQAQLGHEKIDTTVGTYGHLAPESMVNRVRVMDAAMRGVRRPNLELEA